MCYTGLGIMFSKEKKVMSITEEILRKTKAVKLAEGEEALATVKKTTNREEERERPLTPVQEIAEGIGIGLGEGFMKGVGGCV